MDFRLRHCVWNTAAKIYRFADQQLGCYHDNLSHYRHRRRNRRSIYELSTNYFNPTAVHSVPSPVAGHTP